MESIREKNDMKDEFAELLEELNAIHAALTLFDWDNETLAPQNSSERTSRTMGVLSSCYQRLLTGENTGKKIEEMKNQTNLCRKDKAIIRKLEKEREKLKAIPEKEYRYFSELTAISASKWSQAKMENNFSLFAPVLSDIIKMKRKFASYQIKEGENPYDILLDEFEEGFTTEILDDFFERLKSEIIPLVKAVAEKNKICPVNAGFLFQKYDIEKQKKWSCWLAAYLGFDFSRGVLGESEHPFTTSLHKDDVRITTHYYENNLESAIFSTIHETGHALYELGNDDEVTQTPVSGGSCGVHESQSRFYENILGRSRAFWKPLYPRLQKMFPKQLSEISFGQFLLAINRSEPGLIRTESDELTYCLHIIVRYELEKRLIAGELSVDALPEEWSKLYEEYLGITPENDAEGVLQDIHWAMGEFGYFPSYALGNAMASQIYHQMTKDLDVPGLLENQEMGKIAEYLRERIHKYGASKTMNEFLEDITGEPFNPQYYIDYLKKKYRGLYGL